MMVVPNFEEVVEWALDCIELYTRAAR